MRVYVLGSYANLQQQNTEKYFQFIVYWLGQSQKLSQKCEYYAAISRPIQLQLSYSLLLAQCRVRIYLKSIIYIYVTIFGWPAAQHIISLTISFE